MSELTSQIDCAKHGVHGATYVCQHLLAESAAGFHRSHTEDDADQLCPDAWCDACERVRRGESGWSERATGLAGISVVCARCYEEIRERNWKQDDAAFADLVHEAASYLQSQQDHLQLAYHLGTYETYRRDQQSGQLIFLRAERPKVVADFQFVGSVSARSHSWLWSWANRSILESVKHRVRHVREFGEQRQYLRLAAARWPAGADDGWQMTAISAYLLGARGAYHCATDRGSEFLVITNVNWCD